MQPFLCDSDIVDWRAADVLALATRLGTGAADEETIARRCFVWVRDEVRHSVDYQKVPLTCRASDTLRFGTGFCFAKSHLLVALLRANQIPAGFCYQRLALDEAATRFTLHGLVGIHLQRFGWYRVDPRGDKPGIITDFCPPEERLAFAPLHPGERDVPGIFTEPLLSVVQFLRSGRTLDEAIQRLPDDDATQLTQGDEAPRRAPVA